MPVNALTTQAGLRLGPVVLETLVKHYFGRSNKENAKDSTPLHKEELLYDEVFNIVKFFLDAASHHTVEDVQGFANARTPSPPWVHVVRLTIPISCCDKAAKLLIKALGGEEATRHTVGGVKWWQVRGVNGVDAQWITAKKDWREAKRRHKANSSSKKGKGSKYSESETKATDAGVKGGVDEPAEPPIYEEEMDAMRCILYSHGGGYYFGSVDQERYSIQRHARKINGRVFAINYRLAPQYPFPCALQDVLAAYLYLINPPPGAAHRPVKPEHIVIAGDSAGGGISLALLQVIRDSGLPMPAGGVLISPWCDLTHSFPSIHTNTATDVIPKYGLSLQKPSPLWPPPPEELSNRVRAGLRTRIRQALHLPDSHSRSPSSASPASTQRKRAGSTNMPVDVGTTTAVPTLDTSMQRQSIELVAQNGEKLVVDDQVHMYAQNSLIAHPLISSALSYLGGLPPLLIIASDKEVLRDEIIYAAHRAANPERFPIKDEVREMYPPLKGIESRHQPTKVHLQVYDDAAHVLPVLFSFSTPGKYCYRAIATFCRHVTGMHSGVNSPASSSFPSQSLHIPESPRKVDNSHSNSQLSSTIVEDSDIVSSPTSTQNPDLEDKTTGHEPRRHSSVIHKKPSKTSIRRSISANVQRATTSMRKAPRPQSLIFSKEPEANQNSFLHPPALPSTPGSYDSEASSDVAGPRFPRVTSSPRPITPEARYAGDPIVYSQTPAHPSWENGIIRERVSTQGEIRALEPESELDAFTVPDEMIGVLSELAIRRYLDGKAKFDKKFHGAIKAVEKQRYSTLERAHKDVTRKFNHLQNALNQDDDTTAKGVKEGLALTSESWSWAWLVDGNERPPPSSIAARRDTEEARRLAKIADQAVAPDESNISANRLWSVLVNFLTVSPTDHKASQISNDPSPANGTGTVRKRKSTLLSFGLKSKEHRQTGDSVPPLPN